MVLRMRTVLPLLCPAQREVPRPGLETTDGWRAEVEADTRVQQVRRHAAVTINKEEE